MNKKAFTLIELLAVIIILAILATLITPKVVTMLSEAEKNASMTSVEGLLKAATYKYSNNEIKGSNKTTTVNYTTGTNTEYLDYSGNPPEAGQVKIDGNGKVGIAVKFKDYCYKKSPKSNDITVESYDETACKINDSIKITDQQDDSQISVGDEVTIGTETFTVIKSDADETVLLAKYNLYVGKIYSATTYEVLENIEPTDEGYCLQSPIAKGGRYDEDQIVASVPFSQTDYWNYIADNGYRALKEKYNIGNSDYEANIYDEDYDSESGDKYSVAYYVKQYINNLKDLGAPENIRGRLLVWTEFYDLKDNPNANIYNGAAYWLGTPSIYDVLTITFGMGTSPYDASTSNGIRPVIIVDTFDLN